MTLQRPSLARPRVEVTHGYLPRPSASSKLELPLGRLLESEVGKRVVMATWPAQGHPDQPATPRVTPRARPDPGRARPEPYLAFGDPEAHVGLHAGGSAVAP